MMKLVKLFVILFMLYLYLVFFVFFFYKAEPFKVVLHSSYNILFYDLFFFVVVKWIICQKYDFFKKSRRSKLNVDPKLCQFLYFICDVIFDKISELRQISCIILH